MTTSVAPEVPVQRIGGGPTRSVAAASWTALGALMLRDLVVLRKHFWEFVLRTLIQPFLLCFVFLFVFPKIGQGIGGGSGTAAESAFATVLVPGVVGISVMFQGVQSIALAMAQEFGFTREIEDRVQAPCPIWLVAMAKVLSGAAQGILSAAIVLPIASVVHAPGVEAHLSLHWWIIVTFVPLAAVAMAGGHPGVKLEASGGLHLAGARAVAATGVDYVAVGGLTHSAPALDLGLDMSPLG